MLNPKSRTRKVCDGWVEAAGLSDEQVLRVDALGPHLAPHATIQTSTRCRAKARRRRCRVGCIGEEIHACQVTCQGPRVGLRVWGALRKDDLDHAGEVHRVSWQARIWVWRHGTCPSPADAALHRSTTPHLQQGHMRVDPAWGTESGAEQRQNGGERREEEGGGAEQ